MAEITFAYIHNISSVNLRLARGKERKLMEPIGFVCSFCKKTFALGKSSAVMVKMEYALQENEAKEKVLCGRCVDVFVDLVRFGPRVIHEAYRWELMSQVARIAVIQEELFCFKCMGKSDSHVFIKYDDLLSDKLVYGHSYVTSRVCARCATSYLNLIEVQKVTSKRENKFLTKPGVE